MLVAEEEVVLLDLVRELHARGCAVEAAKGVRVAKEEKARDNGGV